MGWFRRELSPSAIAAVEAVPLSVALTCLGFGGSLWAGRDYAAANTLFAVGSTFGLLSVLWPSWALWIVQRRIDTPQARHDLEDEGKPVEIAIKYLQNAKARVNDGKNIDVLPVFRRAARQLAGVGLDIRGFSDLLGEMLPRNVVWYVDTVNDTISEFNMAGLIKIIRQTAPSSGTPSGADLSVWGLTELGKEVRRKLEGDSSQAG